jgi:hypothetical protein
MKKAVAELPGEEVTSLTGEKSLLRSKPLDCKALARATPRCANAPVQQFQTMPLWSRIF